MCRTCCAVGAIVRRQQLGQWTCEVRGPQETLCPRNAGEADGVPKDISTSDTGCCIETLPASACQTAVVVLSFGFSTNAAIYPLL
eukprot:5700815-Amphidinium_carterae.2